MLSTRSCSATGWRIPSEVMGYSGYSGIVVHDIGYSGCTYVGIPAGGGGGTGGGIRNYDGMKGREEAYMEC